MTSFTKIFWVSIFIVFGVSSVVSAQGADAVSQREAQLRSELEQVEAEIAKQQEILKAKQRESVSFERDIAILNAEIEKAKLNIRAKNIAIEQLGKDINTKTSKITELEIKIENSKEALSKLIRKANQADAYSLPELLLANKDLSEFFADVDSFTFVQKSINVFFDEIKNTKEATEEERQALAERKRKETDARVAIESEKRTVERAEAEKKKLLSISRSEEKSYQAVLSEREKKAAQIRTALFQLRDTAAIPFGTALQYANAAERATGVRAAFILAILTQESNLGENVGQCYLRDFSNGSGVGKNTGTVFKDVMKPSRDIAPFIEISKNLNLDPTNIAVSCPIKSVQGYGGAMGPSQFIPSTWAIYGGYVSSNGWKYDASKDIVRKLLGKNSPSNPWEAQDAFVATSIFLEDLGADDGGYSAEQEAAARYYAGGNWWKADGMGYATSVLKIAQNIQENMIDPLQNL